MKQKKNRQNLIPIDTNNQTIHETHTQTHTPTHIRAEDIFKKKKTENNQPRMIKVEKHACELEARKQ